MTDMTEHDAALERARHLLSQPPPERVPPTRMHQRAESEPEPTPQPAVRSGMAPEVQAKWNAWAVGIVKREIERFSDVYSDAIGYSLAQQHKEMDKELAARDERIAELERRLQQLEADATPNVARLIRGGRDAA